MISLTKQYSDAELRKEFLGIIKNYDFTGAKYTDKFIEKFLNLYGLKYGICLNSCTSALIMSLYALGVKRNDKVIMPSYTCKAILDAVNLLGIKPVFADNYLDYKNSDFNLDEEDAIKKINPRVKAIILPYMFGKAHRYEKLQNLRLPIIEDVTLSLGVPVDNFQNNKRIVVSSFHPSKVISSVEGGIIATNDKKFFSRLMEINDVEQTNKADRTKAAKDIGYDISFSFRPSELNFIWGCLQLKRLKRFIKMRQNIAKKYIAELDGAKYELPDFDKNNIYFRFIVGVKQGDAPAVLKYLKNKGIEAGRGVYPLLSDYQKDKAVFPNARKTAAKSLSIPLYPSLSQGEIKYIIKSLNLYEAKNQPEKI